MANIYLLPGLANDEAIFSYLDLGPEVNYVQWVEPLPKETIEAYAKRLSAFISEPDPILVGLSFGGMVSVELPNIFPLNILL